MAMKLFDLCCYLIAHPLMSFIGILKQVRGRHFSGTDPDKIANSQISIFVGEVENLQYFANFFCKVVLFDVL